MGPAETVINDISLQYCRDCLELSWLYGGRVCECGLHSTTVHTSQVASQLASQGSVTYSIKEQKKDSQVVRYVDG